MDVDGLTIADYFVRKISLFENTVNFSTKVIKHDKSGQSLMIIVITDNSSGARTTNHGN